MKIIFTIFIIYFFNNIVNEGTAFDLIMAILFSIFLFTDIVYEKKRSDPK